MKVIAGVDIGGTKCAISFALRRGEDVEVVAKEGFVTPDSFQQSMEEFIATIRRQLEANPQWELEAIGISCGGPLDSKRGLILSPPNLPHWSGVDCVTPLRQAFGVPVAVQNDADACALAEWKWGAGQQCENMIFLTFGTGMGAGLILGGRLYVGSTNLAGEVGHIRLAENGPLGYGKEGSFEGFCSGGGIARLGCKLAKEAIERGTPPAFCRSADDLETISAKVIAEALTQGDPLAQEIYRMVGEYLGRGISVLIDILNPQVIVVGSIFGRQQTILEPVMQEYLKKEALTQSLQTCRIVPAKLGEMVGDYAALSVAANLLEQNGCPSPV